MEKESYDYNTFTVSPYRKRLEMLKRTKKKKNLNFQLPSIKLAPCLNEKISENLEKVDDILDDLEYNDLDLNKKIFIKNMNERNLNRKGEKSQEFKRYKRSIFIPNRFSTLNNNLNSPLRSLIKNNSINRNSSNLNNHRKSINELNSINIPKFKYNNKRVLLTEPESYFEHDFELKTKRKTNNSSIFQTIQTEETIYEYDNDNYNNENDNNLEYKLKQSPPLKKNYSTIPFTSRLEIDNKILIDNSEYIKFKVNSFKDKETNNNNKINKLKNPIKRISTLIDLKIKNENLNVEKIKIKANKFRKTNFQPFEFKFKKASEKDFYNNLKLISSKEEDLLFGNINNFNCFKEDQEKIKIKLKNYETAIKMQNIKAYMIQDYLEDKLQINNKDNLNSLNNNNNNINKSLKDNNAINNNNNLNKKEKKFKEVKKILENTKFTYKKLKERIESM